LAAIRFAVILVGLRRFLPRLNLHLLPIAKGQMNMRFGFFGHL
jgi:hypothetical protein